MIYNLHYFRALPEGSRSPEMLRLLEQEDLSINDLRPFLNTRFHLLEDWMEVISRLALSKVGNWQVQYVLAIDALRNQNYEAALERLSSTFNLQALHVDFARTAIRTSYLVGPEAVRRWAPVFWPKVEPRFRTMIPWLSYSFQEELVFGMRGQAAHLWLEDTISHFRSKIISNRDGSAFFESFVNPIQDVDRIAVVGKGSNSTDECQGPVIDAFPFVIRINHYPKPEEYDRIGSKTDLVICGKHLKDRLTAKFSEMENPPDLLVLIGVKVEGDEFSSEAGKLFYEFSESLSYARGTTGLRALIAASLLSQDSTLVSAFGFDFYTSSKEFRDSAAMGHEIDYEYWYSRNVLPLLSRTEFA